MFHAILIGFLSLINPPADAGPQVFSVDLVDPPESRQSVTPETLPPVSEPKPLLTRRRRRPPPKKEPAPERLDGDAAVSSGRDSKDAVTLVPPDESRKTDYLRDDTEPLSPDTEERGISQDDSILAPRAHLFDRQTIEEHARKSTPANKGLTFDTSEFRHRGYMRMLKERIEDIWRYPKEAAKQGLTGDLYVKFTITKDGKLGKVELLRTSGHRVLDEAAIKAVRGSGPFWPLPADFEKDALEIKGHFIYIFGNTLVM